MDNVHLPHRSSMKEQLMTMFMFKSAYSSETSSMANMVYIFILSQLIDIFIKYLPAIINQVKLKYIKPIDLPIISETNEDTECSITISININDANNVVGLALLDYITNFTNTKHIKYINQRFILNQAEEIALNKHISVCMTRMISNDSSIDNTQSKNENDICQIIKVFSSTYNSKQIRDFITKIHHDYVINIQNKLGEKRYYFNMKHDKVKKFDYKIAPNHFTFTMKPFTTNRKFNNLFGEEISLIKKRVQFFINNKEWYDEKGVPYTLGLLLHGEPGTGKTSCIKCLANETDRHIININLNNPITKTQLENLFFDEYIHILNQSTNSNEKYNIPLDKRLYVFEDIDCQGDIVNERNYDTLDDISEENGGDSDDNSNGLYRSGGDKFGFGNHGDNYGDKYDDYNYSESELHFDKFTNPSVDAISSRAYMPINTRNIKTVKQMWKSKVKQDPRPINLKEKDKDDDCDDNDLVDMSFLLNLLDGVLETPGRIIIMTSNHPETLDRAMIRPGRVDIISKFTVCSHCTIIDMIEFFYNITLTDEQKNQIYALKCNITPAEMGKLMFENFGEPDIVINKLLES